MSRQQEDDVQYFLADRRLPDLPVAPLTFMFVLPAGLWSDPPVLGFDNLLSCLVLHRTGNTTTGFTG